MLFFPSTVKTVKTTQTSESRGLGEARGHKRRASALCFRSLQFQVSPCLWVPHLSSTYTMFFMHSIIPSAQVPRGLGYYTLQMLCVVLNDFNPLSCMLKF